jgi:hypothetical protein
MTFKINYKRERDGKLKENTKTKKSGEESVQAMTQKEGNRNNSKRNFSFQRQNSRTKAMLWIRIGFNANPDPDT